MRTLRELSSSVRQWIASAASVVVWVLLFGIGAVTGLATCTAELALVGAGLKMLFGDATETYDTQEDACAVMAAGLEYVYESLDDGASRSAILAGIRNGRNRQAVKAAEHGIDVGGEVYIEGTKHLQETANVIMDAHSYGEPLSRAVERAVASCTSRPWPGRHR